MSAHLLITGGRIVTANRSTMPASLVRSSMSCAAPYGVNTCRVALPAPMLIPLTVIGRSHHRLPIAAVMPLTCAGAPIVRTPTVPIGHSELTMSMVCLARSPWGVLVSMCKPYAASAGAGMVSVHPQARALTSTTANVVAQYRARLALRRGAGPRNVQHNLELEQRRACGHRVGALSGVCLDGRTGRPRLECLFGLPLRDYEVAVFPLDRTQQLEAEETGLVVDGMCTIREPLLQFRTGVGRDLNCVDLHHSVWAGHVVQATVRCHGLRPADPSRWRGRTAGPGARADGTGQHLVAPAAVADEARRGLHVRRPMAPRARCRRSISHQHRAVRVR